ncbi:MAG: ribonuclease J [Syntrophotaleaceae bacterium]
MNPLPEKLSPLTRADAVRLLPLGGLGEIGMNMMALECQGQWLIIDCGLMFPEAYMMGIDLVLPDVSALDDHADRILGLILTHGHEDHIGAVPFLLQRLGNPPIYATGLTLGLLSNKLEEHDLQSRARLHQVRPRQEVTLGPFRIEFFRSAHSIVDGVGLAIRTPAGLIVHTGDFKIDQTPVDNQPTDLTRLAAYGDEGVLLLLSDSTNVERRGYTLSEREVGRALADILPRCRGLVAVATFSSNIHRIQQVIDVAMACGRKVLINGRSMEKNAAVARELGYLRVPDEVLIDLREMRHLPRDRVVVVTTGSQGEPLSVLSRMAMADYKPIPLEQGDTVILSSRSIPGNEKAIARLINLLYRQGAEVFYQETSEVHVSGHASQEELKLIFSLTRPRFFVPVHGEYRHLVKHAQLATLMGVEKGRAVVLENGTPLVVLPDGLYKEDRVESGRVFVDGKGVGDVGEMQLRDRRHLANHGLVMVLMGIEQTSGTILYGPELFTRGFVPEETSGELLDQARQEVRNLLREHSLEAVSDWEEMQVEVRKTLRRFFNRHIDRRPLILPVVFEQ